MIPSIAIKIRQWRKEKRSPKLFSVGWQLFTFWRSDRGLESEAPYPSALLNLFRARKPAPFFCHLGLVCHSSYRSKSSCWQFESCVFVTVTITRWQFVSFVLVVSPFASVVILRKNTVRTIVHLTLEYGTKAAANIVRMNTVLTCEWHILQH